MIKKDMDPAFLQDMRDELKKHYKKCSRDLVARENDLQRTSMDLAVGLSEVIEALRAISAGNPDIRIRTGSNIELVRKLKQSVNENAKNIGEIVNQSHEFAISLAEHFDVLHKVSLGDLDARVTGRSRIELLRSLKKVTNETIMSIQQGMETRRQYESQLYESEKRYRSIIESMPMGMHIYRLEGNGRLVFVGTNPAADDILGVKNEQFIGKTIEKAFPGLRHTDIPDAYRRVALSGTTWHADQILYEENQIKGVFEVWAFSISPRNIVAAFQDITARRQLEEKILNASKQWKRTFDAVDDLILLIDTSYRIQRVNAATAKKVGLPFKEIIGKQCFEVLHKKQFPCEHCPHRLTLADGKPHMIEENFTDTLHGYYSITTSPILSEEGNLSGTVYIARDVTGQKKMEEDVQRMAKMEVIGRLAGGVAHEVRNPLNAIMIFTETLSRDLEQNSKYKPLITHIRSQVDRLLSMMKDLLNLGKPIEKSNLSRESMNTICLASIDLWKHAPISKSFPVRYVPPEDPDVYVISDHQKLQQVFYNLFDNAARHSPEGSEINVVFKKSSQDICRVQIIDKGVGIRREIAGKVFEPFFTTRRGGTGLGLSLVKHIIEFHGGEVEIFNNNPPPGCTVEIRLPKAGREKP
jgi:PAS domain S-box-containing protein